MASDNFDEFYKDLKQTEKADSKLTPKQQIDRLLRPGCTYRNLNPYDVLQVDPELPFEDVKKKYRRLSILVRQLYFTFERSFYKYWNCLKLTLTIT